MSSIFWGLAGIEQLASLDDHSWVYVDEVPHDGGFQMWWWKELPFLSKVYHKRSHWDFSFVMLEAWVPKTWTLLFEVLHYLVLDQVRGKRLSPILFESVQGPSTHLIIMGKVVIAIGLATWSSGSWALPYHPPLYVDKLLFFSFDEWVQLSLLKNFQGDSALFKHFNVGIQSKVFPAVSPPNALRISRDICEKKSGRNSIKSAS